MLPCLIFEDEHLLVVNKPAGLNTHAPAPYAGEGLYEWLRDREPRWSQLAIIHRLDKETSGLIVFSKTKAANRELTKQFENRQVSKKYVFLSAGKAAANEFTVKGCLARAGERYLVRPIHAGGLVAETRLTYLGPSPNYRALGQAVGRASSRAAAFLWEAEPKTGRTHQIRVHAAQIGIPILGDVLYGGEPAPRVYLHAAELVFSHPATGKPLEFRVEPQFQAEPRLQLRRQLIDSAETDCYRLLHGAADGQPGCYVDRLGPYLLSQSERELSAEEMSGLRQLATTEGAKAAYHKILARAAKGRAGPEAHPKLILGDAAPERFTVKENGLRFELSFQEGYSVGLFLDQRDNRRRLLHGRIGAEFPVFSDDNRAHEVLNTFSYTCAFSVCAAKYGAHVTSLDLSKKYLDWGKQNFELNGLDPRRHAFIYGDVFDWLLRLAKKGRQFDLVLLDPPTFSQSKESGTFRADKDYGKLVRLAVPLLKPNGTLFCSCNTATWDAAEFMATARSAVTASGRTIAREQYCPQPPDFRISREEPAYLKSVWLWL